MAAGFVHKADDASTAVDLHVGTRIKMRRTILGVGIEVLARMTKLTCAELREIERGEVRIDVEDLYILAKHLEAPVSWFFEGLFSDSAADTRTGVDPKHADGADLLSYYYDQSSKPTRDKIVKLARILHEGDE